jgi:hypothetical protein
MRFSLCFSCLATTKRYAELVKRGVRPEMAKSIVGSNQGPWHLSLSQAMSIALSNAEFASLGQPRWLFCHEPN